MKPILFGVGGFIAAVVFCQAATASNPPASSPINSLCANAGIGLPVFPLLAGAVGFIVGMES